MNREILKETVKRLVAEPKGILAIDESLPTCNKRFEKLGVPTTEENRRVYRELLVSAPDIEKYVSGYILFDETIRQSGLDGESFAKKLTSKGIEVGIKVDEGTADYARHPGEKITRGLDGLSSRLEEYKSLGASFAKWRAVYSIGDSTPSVETMEENANIFAEYALSCHDKDIVPIVEPEVLIDGAHTIEQCYKVTAQNLQIIFEVFKQREVFIPGIILKTSMVISGKDSANRASTEDVAKMTIKCFRENVPDEIGGIVFLSGGQGDEEVLLNLDEMKKVSDLPWSLTFSFGRAIQNPALKHWAQNQEDVSTAQALLLDRARASSQASMGQYLRS